MFWKSKEKEESKEEIEYVSVTGYKGVFKDMSNTMSINPQAIYYWERHGELILTEYKEKVTYIIDKEPKINKRGFHFCLRLEDVFKKYPFNFKNRYFFVHALVPRKDFEKIRDSNEKIDSTLAAKSIVLEYEIFPHYDEIPKNQLSIQYGDEFNYQITKEDFISIKNIGYNNFFELYFSRIMKEAKHTEFFSKVILNSCKNNVSKMIYFANLAKSFYEEGVSKDVSVYLLMSNVQ